MNVIGITGALGSGKSTLARLILQSFSNGKIIPFSYPLKKAAVDLGWNGKKDKDGRRLLQLLGTEIGRECIDEDIWVNKWEITRSEAKEHCDIIIADDMRFPNEMDHVQYLRGITISIEGRDSYETLGQMHHASETGLVDRNDFNFIFDNSCAIDDMQIFAKTVVDYLNVYL